METDDMNDGGKIEVSFNMDELVLIADAIMNNTLKILTPNVLTNLKLAQLCLTE